MDISTKKILIGVSGGIAAYKSPLLVRMLIKAGAEVRVVMTQSAQKFVTPLTMATLSENEVGLDLFDQKPLSEMLHIDWAEWADLALIAPATANCIAKTANGLADDLLSNLILAMQCPIVFAPAMHHQMWSHPAVQQNINTLKEFGYYVINPVEGELASGDIGIGRMPEPNELVEFVMNI